MSRKKKRTGYINYNYEDTFEDALEKADRKRIEELLARGSVKSVYATKTIKAGQQFEVEIYPEFTRRQGKELGLKRTSNAQRNLNDRNARKRVERLINTNFKNGDYWLTLTYDKKHLPADIEEAKKNMKNFIKRMNYRRNKEGLGNAKYIYITEHRSTGENKVRCHHHMILDCELSAETVEKMWKCGRRNNIRRIEGDEEGLTGLANYMTKDPAGAKRWCASTNLKQPEERKSYSRFKESHVRKIVQGKLSVKELVEKRYPKMTYTKEEIRYNEVNGKFYIYVRMRERRDE